MEYCSACTEKKDINPRKAVFEVSYPDSNSVDAVQWVCKYHMVVWIDNLDQGDVIQVVGMKEL